MYDHLTCDHLSHIFPAAHTAPARTNLDLFVVVPPVCGSAAAAAAAAGAGGLGEGVQKRGEMLRSGYQQIFETQTLTMNTQQKQLSFDSSSSKPAAKNLGGAMLGIGLAISYGLSGAGSYGGQGMSLGSTYGSGQNSSVVRLR